MTSNNDAEFLRRVKTTVQTIDPSAEVWLFGSRARGDARDDSDWDFLVLTGMAINKTLKNQLRDRLFDIELDTNKVISSIIHSKTEWEDDYKVTPLYRNIKRASRSL